MHKYGWAHLDIKLENIVLDKHMKCQVIDFGYALRVLSMMDTKRGTFGYRAPEISALSGRKKAIDASKADVFSLGVTLMAMFFVDIPFSQEKSIPDLTSGNPEKVEKYCRMKYGNYTQNFPKNLMCLLA